MGWANRIQILWVNSATLLRTLARKLYPGATDKQIIDIVFPKRALRRAPIAKKPIANIVQALSDAASRDCASECRGSGASCYQHCNQYRFKI